MKRVLGAMLIGVCVALLLTAVAVAETQRQLTPEERAAITAYLDARVEWYRKVYGTNWDAPSHRNPYHLCAEYQSFKAGWDQIGGKRYYRFTSRPEFPGWQDACYTWEPDGKYVRNGSGQFTESQLYCSKCQAWVFVDGRSCANNHPLPLMDQWRFCVTLIAQRTEKPGDKPLRRGGPLEARAILWDALQHGDLTEAQWDELMILVDSIEAEAAAKAAAEVKSKAGSR